MKEIKSTKYILSVKDINKDGSEIDQIESPLPFPHYGVNESITLLFDHIRYKTNEKGKISYKCVIKKIEHGIKYSMVDRSKMSPPSMVVNQIFLTTLLVDSIENIK